MLSTELRVGHPTSRSVSCRNDIIFSRSSWLWNHGAPVVISASSKKIITSLGKFQGCAIRIEMTHMMRRRGKLEIVPGRSYLRVRCRRWIWCNCGQFSKVGLVARQWKEGKRGKDWKPFRKADTSIFAFAICARAPIFGTVGSWIARTIREIRTCWFPSTVAEMIR